MAIICIVFLTVLDVILRRLGHPIDFAYEIVVFLAVIVIGFALPQVSLDKGHVVMEFVTSKVSEKWAKLLFVATRLMGIGTFAIIGWNTMLYAGRLREAGQSSAMLKIPEFPVAYAIAVICIVECLVLFYQLFETKERAQS
jgi:TRAP-type C4-dicarboxylate transport system permease small subunit